MTHHQTSPLEIDGGFAALDLSPVILQALSSAGYEQPTPIQAQTIPLILQGRDVQGLAQTGTGKTAAFGLPIIENLMGNGSKPAPKTVRALILAPTRELASQISETLIGFVRRTHLRVVTTVGGKSIHTQERNLAKGADILVATPGRLLDLEGRKSLDLSKVRYLVLDEADQMLDLGFIHSLRKIAKMVPAERQTLLFSATMAKDIESLGNAFLSDPVRVAVTSPGKTADKIRQSVRFASQREKTNLLVNLLSERPEDLSLVFARTKHGAERIKRRLEADGFAAGSIHGNKSQNQRDRAIKQLKSGELRILVATDVAARGIDIPDVSHVYNFDLPDVPAVYVHRIGRTARAGKSGEAISFCSSEERSNLKAIEKMLGIRIDAVGGNLTEIPETGDGVGKVDQANDGERPGRRNNRRRPGAKRAEPGHRPSRKPAKAKSTAEGAHTSKGLDKPRRTPNPVGETSSTAAEKPGANGKQRKRNAKRRAKRY